MSDTRVLRSTETRVSARGVKIVVWALLLAAVGGCGSHTNRMIAGTSDTNIERCVNSYVLFRKLHVGAGPKDEAEFKTFITNELPEDRARLLSIDRGNVDAMMTSERDGKQFKIKYGQAGGASSNDPLVFEAEGIGGRRQVGFAGGATEEVDEARYNQLWEKGGVPSGPSS